MDAITKQLQQEDYHIACQNCGVQDKPLHIILLRNEKHVVGMIYSCDGCGGELGNKRFDRREKLDKEDKENKK